MASAPNTEMAGLQGLTGALAGNLEQTAWNANQRWADQGWDQFKPLRGEIAEQKSDANVGIEDDFHGWLLDQASALREQRYSALDLEHLAEELEAMAARERRELKNQLKRLLVHLLKLKAQPDARNRHHSWITSVRNAREELQDLLEDSPGIFAGERDQVLAECYSRAVRQAADEAHLPESDFPPVCPWTFDKIKEDEFFAGVQRSERRSER